MVVGHACESNGSTGSTTPSLVQMHNGVGDTLTLFESEQSPSHDR